MLYTPAVVATSSTALADLRLRVLYFNPSSQDEFGKEAIAERGHDITAATTSAEALVLLLDQSFDAVVIENQDEDLDVIDFTIEVNRIDPLLPVFLTGDWGPDLAVALENVASGAFASH